MRVLEYPGGTGGGITLERYQNQVLHSALYDFYWEETENQGFVAFQQDGARCRTSRSIQQWFQDNHIEMFPHPASSLDLNPIEPIWHTLKQIIRSRPHSPTSLEGLKQAVRDAWDEISVEHINAHIKHMSDHCKAVLAAKGGHTKY